jgi:BolA protein
MNEKRINMIRERLTDALQPQSLHIIDESHKHVGHAQAGAGGHFAVEIVSDAFKDKNPMQRHRLVYDILGEAMKTEIHALSIKASTPDEKPD